jgi:hypothetical protein
MDDDLKVTGNIFYDGGWIQDCTRLPNGNIVLNDVDNTVQVVGGPLLMGAIRLARALQTGEQYIVEMTILDAVVLWNAPP